MLAGDAADATHERGAFGGGDDATGVEHVEEVRTLQAMVVGGEDREALGLFSLRLLEGFQ